MRRVLAIGAILGGFLVPCVAARGQALGGPTFGNFGMPDGLYTSISVPGMGRGGPGLWMYFPSTGGNGSFTPTPMAGSVAGLQLPVTGTGGSVYLPAASSPLTAPPRGGGLGLPSPAAPVATPVAVRPAAAKKAAVAKAQARAEARALEEPKRAPEQRSTLKERRGIR
jgi:hypothetical protein